MKRVPLNECTLMKTNGITQFEAFNQLSNYAQVTMGLVELELSETGEALNYSSHEGDEYSYIIEGESKAEVGGERLVLKAGDFSYIPRGVLHRSFRPTLAPCRLLWMIIN